MIYVETVFLPRHLLPGQLQGQATVVFDVLRATTTVAAALSAGVKEIRVFADLASAAAAAQAFDAEEAAGDHRSTRDGSNDPNPPNVPRAGRLLCGEVRCLPPPGFDLGNSPGAFSPTLHVGRVMFLSTTNGTRGIVAARQASAQWIFAGALVNAAAVSRRLMTLAQKHGGANHAGANHNTSPSTSVSADLGVTLLCSGTDGGLSMEDAIGAGAVIDHLSALTEVRPASDATRMALALFQSARPRLGEVLADTVGGRNVLAAGLGPDLDFCARLDAFDLVGRVHADPLRIVVEPPAKASCETSQE